MKKLIAAILFAAVAVAPLALAQPMSNYGWRGYMRVCIAENDCRYMQSRDTFDTERACQTEMIVRAERMRAMLASANPPIYLFSLRLVCAEDRNAPNI